MKITTSHDKVDKKRRFILKLNAENSEEEHCLLVVNYFIFVSSSRKWWQFWKKPNATSTPIISDNRPIALEIYFHL